MNILDGLKKFWKYLKRDSWDSWIVSLILAFVIIKFVFFPLLSFVMAAPLPLVVVESCSMYHSTDFNDWWDRNEVWYENRNIFKGDFGNFPFKNGLNKGDIILVSGRVEYSIGDIIIFDSSSSYRFPLIHRVIEEEPIETKGDNNFGQLEVERDIDEEMVLGKSIARIPGLGWVKLIFFEGTRAANERGFCR